MGEAGRKKGGADRGIDLKGLNSREMNYNHLQF